MRTQEPKLSDEFLAQIEPVAHILIDEIHGFSTERLRDDLPYLTNLARRIRELLEPARSAQYESLLRCTKSLYNRLEPLTFEAEVDELELQGIGETLFSLSDGLSSVLKNSQRKEFLHLDEPLLAKDSEILTDPGFSFLDPFHPEKSEFIRFIQESQEIIERLHGILQRSASGLTSKALGEEFLREIHGMKGTSAFFPELRTTFTRLCHETETVFMNWLHEDYLYRPQIQIPLISRVLQVFELLLENLKGRLTRDFAPHPTLRVDSTFASLAKWAQGEEINPESILASNLIPAGTDTLIRIPFARIDTLVEDVHSLRLLTGGMREKFQEDPIVLKSIKPLQEGLTRLQNRVLDLRLFPIGLVFQRFLRIIREHGKSLGKEVRFEIHGSDTRIDQTTANTLSIPLTHLVRNALDHGLETPSVRRKAGKPPQGTISLVASQRNNRLLVEVSDDGMGIQHFGYPRGKMAADDDLMDFLTQPGFSTLEEATTTSGRGIGLHIVRREVEKHGGNLKVQSSAGDGTKFLIDLPLTFYTTDCMLLSSGGQIFAVALDRVREILSTKREVDSFHKKPGAEAEIGFKETSLFSLMDPQTLPPSENHTLILESWDHQKLSLRVEKCLGKEHLLIRPLESPFLRTLHFSSSAAALSTGQLCCVLDVDLFIEHLHRRKRVSTPVVEPSVPRERTAVQKLLERLFSDPDRGRILSFESCGQLFAIPLHFLKEVTDYSTPMRLPMVPEIVLGLISLRGIPIPLVNLMTLFSKSPTDPLNSCILILQHFGTLTGVPISRLRGIRLLEPEDLTAPATDSGSPIISKFYIDGNPGHLLDPRRLFESGIRSFSTRKFGGSL